MSCQHELNSIGNLIGCPNNSDVIIGVNSSGTSPIKIPYSTLKSCIDTDTIVTNPYPTTGAPPGYQRYAFQLVNAITNTVINPNYTFFDIPVNTNVYTSYYPIPYTGVEVPTTPGQNVGDTYFVEFSNGKIVHYTWNGSSWTTNFVIDNAQIPALPHTRIAFGDTSNLLSHDANFNVNINDFSLRLGGGSLSPSNVNFLGNSAGLNANLANGSNFFGVNAGNGATNASYSNFFGRDAGFNATGALYSNFIGYGAGIGASSAFDSSFIGRFAGNNATNASGSNFIGLLAGNGSDAFWSNYIGYFAGNNASNGIISNFIGVFAGENATNANNSNFIGIRAGRNATSSFQSNFIGGAAGEDATNAVYSNFIGNEAGFQAINAVFSNFIGFRAGYISGNAYTSNFIGTLAGYNSPNAYASNFFGYYAGSEATNAYDSIFIGSNSGQFSANSSYSVFIGYEAGYNSPNARNSIFIGRNSGSNDIVDNTNDNDDYSILIGHETSTGGFSNSVAIGGYAVNTRSNQLMIGSSTRPLHVDNPYGGISAAQGSDVASSPTLLLTKSGNSFAVTGTNTINHIDDAEWIEGSEVTLFLPPGITLTNMAGNLGTSTQMRLAGSINLTTISETTITFVLSTVGGIKAWREKSRVVY